MGPTISILRRELGAYNSLLLEKPEYIIVSRTDLVEKNRIVELTHSLSPFKKEIIPLSISDKKQMTEMRKVLDRIIKEITAPALSM